MATSFNGVKIAKVKVTNHLGAFVNDVERRAGRAALQALVLGGSEASVLTPIDTGNLINSRFNSISKEGTKVIGVTGYTADYALPVNDPANPQNFRRPSAEKDFLRKGFENAKPNIDRVVAETLKV
jgi:hypothetical protein